MTPELLLRVVIRPVLAEMGPRFQGRNAERMLIAIAMQETKLAARQQLGGPAMGWWQFERGGGVHGVMTHPASATTARNWLAAWLIPESEQSVYRAIAQNDIIACVFARLLLFTDADPLPTNANAGWVYYLRNWRPGQPHPETWPASWAAAERAVP